MTLLYEVVQTSKAVGATRSRKEKIATVADLFRRLEPEEVPIASAMLAGEPRQGKIGVGFRTLWSLEVEPADEPTISIVDLDSAIDAVGDIIGAGSQADRSSVLAALLARATEVEQEFIRNVLVGGLRQGALEGIVIEAVAKAEDVPAKVVRRALMLRSDLAAVADAALAGGREALESFSLQVLAPIRPMLAGSAEDVGAALAKVGAASVEWKLDGIRVQVHRHEDEVRVFTRNLNEITGRVPDVVAAARKIACRDIVLDGEAILLSGGRPRPFQDTMSGLGTGDDDDARPHLPEDPTTVSTGFAEASEENSGARLMPFFFDALHLDGEDLVDRPLHERLTILDRVVPAEHRITRVMAEDSADAERCLQEALEHGHEGVVVKRVDGIYDAGRRGTSWLKVKPTHTFDLVVLAVEWGHGRRQGWLSNLHLGARDPESGELVMVGKTFKGMTDKMLQWQTARFKELAIDGVDYHVVKVHPEQVVEVAIDGIQNSIRYPGGLALRFARVKRYREDKNPADVDTLDALRNRR